MARTFKVKAVFEGEDRSASRATKGFRGALEGLASFVRDRFVFTLGDAANAVRTLFSSIEEAGTLQSQTEALRRNLAAQGQSFDEFIAKLREVSDAQVSTADLIKSSSQALLLGIPADKIAELLEVARVSAIATGQSVSQAFADIATGIGRASPLILDNLGITLKLGEVYGQAAAAVNKTTEELTQQEKSAALLNAVLATGTERIEQFGDAQSKAGSAIGRATALFQDFADVGKRALGVVALSFSGAVVIIGRAATGIVGALTAILDAFVDLAAKLPVLAPLFSQFTGATEAAKQALNRASDALREWDYTISEASAELLGLTEQTEVQIRSQQDLTESVQASGPVITSYSAELLRLRAEAEEVPESLETARDGFDLLTTGVLKNRDELDQWIEQQRRIRAEILQTNAALDEQNSKFSKNLLGGTSDYAQIGGGTFSKVVNPLGKATSNLPAYLRPNGV